MFCVVNPRSVTAFTIMLVLLLVFLLELSGINRSIRKQGFSNYLSGPSPSSSSSSSSNNNNTESKSNNDINENVASETEKTKKTTTTTAKNIVSSPPLTYSLPSSSSSSFWFRPKKVPGGSKTETGKTELWSYELPESSPNAITEVYLRKNIFLPQRVKKEKEDQEENEQQDSPNSKKDSSSSSSSSSVAPAGATRINLEKMDLRIALHKDPELVSGRRKCNKVPHDKMGSCYSKMMSREVAKLFTTIVGCLKLVPQQVRLDPAKVKNRFYFDLGSRTWNTGSTSWFVESYPESNLFHAEAWDINTKYGDSFPREKLQKHFKSWKFVNAAVWVHDRGITWSEDGTEMGSLDEVPYLKEKKKKTAKASSQVENSKSSSNSRPNQRPPPPAPTTIFGAKKVIKRSAPSIDFSDYLINLVKNKEKDFVVIKMDLEFAEWKVLEKMIESGAIYLVDEMFLECHVPEPWPAIHPRCVDLQMMLRKMGVACHRWV